MKLTDTLGKQQRSPRKLFLIFITNCMLYIQVGGGGGLFIISFVKTAIKGIRGGRYDP